MTDTKSLLKSKTFWGALVPVAIGIIRMAVAYGTPGFVSVAEVQLPVVVSGLFAIYGRKVAFEQIG
jgi:hypothetical protein